MARSNRRQFLQTTASIGVTMSASGSTFEKPGHFTIDCQSHLFVPELISKMKKRKRSPYVYEKDGETFVVVGEWVRKLQPRHTDLEAKIADMDEAGISMSALSINDPGPELFGDEGVAVAQMLNDHIAEAAKKYPNRLFGLTVLPLQNVDTSLKELDRSVSKLGMKGILLYSNLDGAFPDEQRFRPLFEHAERLDVPVLLHPAYPMTYEATKGYNMAAGLGLMFDTTIALARMILAGIPDQYPKLKLVCPHVGGTLPYLIGRIDHQTQVLKRGAENLKKAPSEYLRHIYLDSVSPIAMAIRYGIDYVGIDRMLYSSDHPWVDPKTIIGLIKSLKLSTGDEAKIFGSNAKALFSL